MSAQWFIMANELIDQNPNLTPQLRGQAKELIDPLMRVASAIVGNLELSYLRGFQDAQADKPGKGAA